MILNQALRRYIQTSATARAAAAKVEGPSAVSGIHEG